MSLTEWHTIGDMERTALQETGIVILHGNTPLVAVLAMVDDLGIKHEEVFLAKGHEGLCVNLMQGAK